MEIWKTIKEFEDYQVSTLGNIRSLKFGKERILKKNINSSGYFCCNISINVSKSFYLHRLIAESFIYNPENKKEINHINGIKTDNRIENLEWCTRSENMKHAYVTGLKKDKRRKLNKNQVLDILNNCVVSNKKNKSTVLYFSIKYNVSKSTITKIIRQEIYKIL
jgi:hypothetical protein